MTYQVFGWINLRESASGDFADPDAGPGRFDVVQDAIDATNWGIGTTLELRRSPISDVLVMIGRENHTTELPELVGDLLSLVAAQFPGSFGLVYEHSDERDSDWLEEFRVRVMIRGQVTLRDDPFFSPIHPTIED